MRMDLQVKKNRMSIKDDTVMSQMTLFTLSNGKNINMASKYWQATLYCRKNYPGHVM